MKIITQTKIKKWGNSFGIRLPIEIISKQGICDGTLVKLFQNKDNIIIKPMVEKSKKTAKDLISKINSKNIHNKVDWGDKKGKEIW